MSIEDYVIVIPSHKRCDILINKTLSLLDYYNINHKKIYVFVSDECYDEYKDALPININLIKSVEGVSNNRMFISNYFKKDKFIVSLDDDIDKINKKDGEEVKPLKDLEQLILHSYNLLKQNNLKLLGIYPVNNPFFMKDKYTTDLRFCIGQMRFYFNDRQCEERKFNLLEDYETTLKYYLKYGGVIRLNNISVKANYLTLKGGMNDNTDRSLDAKELECNRFFCKYSNYCKISSTSKRCEIKFRKPRKDLFVNTLWVGEKLNELSRLSIKSWLNQGYKVNLWCYDTINDLMLDNDNIFLKDANDIIKSKNNLGLDILPFSDYWRFKLLYKYGGIWLDADMVLLDNLPDYDIIISAEHTMQSRAYASHREQIANIGCLKFPKDDELLKDVIDKIDSKKNKSVFCDNMRVFQKCIKESGGYDSWVCDKDLFCAIPWFQSKEMYYDSEYKEKYAVVNRDNDWVIHNAIGIHMWNNKTYSKNKIDFENLHKESLYSLLKELI
tara:strand:- start:398 stop:1894 length:1497 start_codon:yes stop_codon:yes gene_type:complete